MLPISHDEVVHGKGSLLRKMPGDLWQQLANLRALLAFMWAHPGKQLLFMGCELGQDPEWTEARGLDWWLLRPRRPPRRAAAGRATSTAPTATTPALWSQDTTPAGFRWIDADDAGNNVFSLRCGTAPTAQHARLRGQLRRASRTRTTGSACRRRAGGQEVLNTDADAYGGSGVGNLGAVDADGPAGTAWKPRRTVLPPLSTVYLRHNG